MKKILTLLIITTNVILLVSFTHLKSQSELVPYPEGYREWTHVKTAIIDSQSKAYNRFGGFHHIYANDKALQGLKAGSYEDGASFVFDVLEAVRKGGDIVEGKRRMIDVMIKNTKLYGDTGGWGFEEFKEDSKTERTVKEATRAQCLNCHASKEKAGFVFSLWRP